MSGNVMFEMSFKETIISTPHRVKFTTDRVSIKTTKFVQQYLQNKPVAHQQQQRQEKLNEQYYEKSISFTDIQLQLESHFRHQIFRCDSIS